MRTVILCGGKGTRAYPHTIEVPKPLLEVGDRPVLGHLMEIFAGQGFRDFVLAAGYKLPLIDAFVATLPSGWDVEVVDTGEDTNTGGRVRHLAGGMDEDFFLTYADGLGNVDLPALASFHRAHRGLVTLTTVPMPSQYGTLELRDDGRVTRFMEKPRLDDHLINAGFLVVSPAAFDRWPEPGEDLERDVLPAFAAMGELHAFRHRGFWRSMDTYKDALELGSLCQGRPGPWLDQPPSDDGRAQPLS